MPNHRTRTIQRTPNVGLALKMQPLREAAPCEPCEPCVPAPEAIRWYNEDDDAWDLEVIERSTNMWGHFHINVVTPGELMGECIVERAMYLARVVGPICDNEVEWEWELAESIGDYWYIQPAGAALGVNITPPGNGLPAGVLTVTATVAGVTLGPIYFILSDPVWCC